MRGLPSDVKAVDEDILSFIGRGLDHRDDAGFNRLALRSFDLQYKYIPLYRRYCQRRGATPDNISSWKDVPPVFTDVFKTVRLTLLPSHTVRTFMTSGTVNPDQKGRVDYDMGGIELMKATISHAASGLLFPDGIKSRLFVIAPSPDIAPNMIMAFGMDRLKDSFGLQGSRFFIGKDGLDADGLADALRSSEEDNIPATICGGSFGFINFFDFLRTNRLKFRLPKGSRCLDAGGIKGKSRDVIREEFLDYCEEFLWVLRGSCVNLIGMTETASQYYDNNLKNRILGVDNPPAKFIPPWTRVMVVNPDTLEPLPVGETGLLRYFDLANRGHICAVQTDDLGRIVDGGFEVSGRAGQGDVRGCSLTIEEMSRMTGIMEGI